MAAAARFAPSAIKNKIKRGQVARRLKKSKIQQKLQRRKAREHVESTDPVAKKERLLENVPRTLDSTREFDPSVLAAEPLLSNHGPGPSGPSRTQEESAADVENDPFALHFTSSDDPLRPPKVLITTSPKATKATFDFCNELVGIFPGAEFVRRHKSKGFELGWVAGWAADRGFKHLFVVNEDMKRPNAVTMVHLPGGPTAHFKLTSVELTRKIFGHARATPHNPELILNNFVTRLGHTVGRMFQTLFPPMPEFQGRQVITLHNQRDFLFFRRHRYAFRSPEKVALQEIGPRFTLKLRWLKSGIPAVPHHGEAALHLDYHLTSLDEKAENFQIASVDAETIKSGAANGSVPPTENALLWAWKPQLEASRHTFFM